MLLVNLLTAGLFPLQKFHLRCCFCFPSAAPLFVFSHILTNWVSKDPSIFNTLKPLAVSGSCGSHIYFYLCECGDFFYCNHALCRHSLFCATVWGLCMVTELGTRQGEKQDPERRREELLNKVLIMQVFFVCPFLKPTLLTDPTDFKLA